MAIITKSGANALSLTAVTHPGNVKGTTLDVSTKLSATIDMFAARVEATANTNAGTFYVRTSAQASGDQDWATKFKFTMNSGTVPAGVALGANESIGDTVIELASTTGFVAGDLIYLKDGTLSESEFRYIRSLVANTSVTLFDGLTAAKTITTDFAWPEAEHFGVTIDLTSVRRLRVDFVHELGTPAANCDVKAEVTYGDSIG